MEAACALLPPVRPTWAEGKGVPLADIPAFYHEALRPIAWLEDDSPEGELLVPEWALRVCTLSRHGRSPLLRTWIEWCAGGGSEAAKRAQLIQSMARLMPRDEALRAIREMVQGGH
jgi:hypothetical protein